MKKLFLIFCMAATIFTFSMVASAAEKFIVGVAPHTSARVILDMYQPLRLYLEKTLGYTVDIVTAPDFNEFARRGLAQNYDLAITTALQARLFQTDAGYIPMLTYKADFKSVAVIAANGPIKKPSDLNNKGVLGLSPSSQVTLWGQHWLKENKIVTLPIRYVSASDSVGQLVAAGEASAGFMSLANFQKLPDGIRRQLKFLAESKPMPGRVYMLNGRHAHEQKKIDDALWSFAATAEAIKYFETNNLEGYRKLKPNELNSMDPYAAEIRRVIQQDKTK